MEKIYIVKPKLQNWIATPSMDWMLQTFYFIFKFPNRKPELIQPGKPLTSFCFCPCLFLLEELLGNLDGDFCHTCLSVSLYSLSSSCAF